MTRLPLKRIQRISACLSDSLLALSKQGTCTVYIRISLADNYYDPVISHVITDYDTPYQEKMHHYMIIVCVSVLSSIFDWVALVVFSAQLLSVN